MPHLKSFEEAERRIGTLNRLPPRLAPVEVRRIIGSVTTVKVAALTGEFLARSDGGAAPRYMAVYNAMQSDIPLPPIELYALRKQYYVVDGHHRVAAARALGYLYLDALVHEFLLPATTPANKAHNEGLYLERVSGLTGLTVTEPGAARKLLSQIREHRFFLGQAGQPVTLKAAATDWYEYVYGPIAARLTASGIPDHFPQRTMTDIYVYLCDYKWVRSQNRGLDIGFPKAMADFEHLYPPLQGTSAGLAAVRQVFRTLMAPMRRTEVDATAQGEGEAQARRCAVCAAPLSDGEALTCSTCHPEAEAV